MDPQDKDDEIKKHNNKMCMECLLVPNDSIKLLTCGKCKTAKYCSKDCQTKHWPAHKKICKDSNTTVRDDKNLAKAEVYSGSYNYAKSAKYYNKVLKSNKQSKGENSYDTLKTIGALAGSYFDQGEFQKAEEMYKDLLQRSISLYGPMDHCTLTTEANYGGVLKALGKLAEAETLIKECVRKSIIVHGELAKDTLNTINNLASVYRVQRKYDDAISLLSDVVKKYKVLNGPDSDDENLMKAMNNLANVYHSIGTANELKNAEEIFKIIAKKRAVSLGINHPLTTLTNLNLGNVYCRMKKYDDAEPLIKSAYETNVKTLGASHIDTLSCKLAIAVLHDGRGELDKAELVLVANLKTLERTIGLNNMTAHNCSEFLNVIRNKKRYQM